MSRHDVRNVYFTTQGIIPPKLPETTNLVLTSNKNEYSEMSAIKMRTPLENKIPPLKNLDDTVS